MMRFLETSQSSDVTWCDTIYAWNVYVKLMCLGFRWAVWLFGTTLPQRRKSCNAVISKRKLSWQMLTDATANLNPGRHADLLTSRFTWQDFFNKWIRLFHNSGKTDFIFGQVETSEYFVIPLYPQWNLKTQWGFYKQLAELCMRTCVLLGTATRIWELRRHEYYKPKEALHEARAWSKIKR